MFRTVTKFFRDKVIDLFVEKTATHTLSINQDYKVNTSRMVIMCFSDYL